MNVTLLQLPFPALLLLAMLSAGGITWLLRRWHRPVALASAAFAGSMAALLWLVDFATPVWIMPVINQALDLTAPLARMGYQLQLQSSTIAITALTLGISAIAFFLSARSRQQDAFVPLLWVISAGYVALSLIATATESPALVTPLYLLIINSVAIFALQGRRTLQNGANLRLLLPAMLATPLFLVAAWYVDQLPLNPQDQTFAQVASSLVSIGLLFLLAPFPLHGGRTAPAETAQPVAFTTILLLNDLALLATTARIVNSFDFIRQQIDLPVWLSSLGLLTALFAGLFTIGASHAGRMVALAALYDWGILLLALALPGTQSWTLVISLYTLRVVSIFTAATGLSALEQSAGTLELASLKGAANRLPWNTAAFLLGGLGLLGFPLSAGFSAHWAALLLYSEADWRPVLIVALASGPAIIAFMRAARILFGQLENRTLGREQPLSVMVAVLALAITIGLATAPQLLNTFLTRVLVAFG